MGRVIKPELRIRVKAKYPGRCGYCGVETSKIHIDHIKPVAHGGQSTFENLMPSCFGCNNYKLVWSVEEFRTNIAAQIERSRKANINFRLAERFGLIEITGKPVIFYFEKASQARSQGAGEKISSDEENEKLCTSAACALCRGYLKNQGEKDKL